ncbi:hypothetical protein VB773_21895 [Haloarculaceae archaeon H-GB2-1]|nr:hypothetical protein [Haloarculaceae archaeon H-GB1-1]MEA5389590.1 hypothetical protein [Haloarculaceae archaeon H-GB11]MEA5409958.1 hypothetical protein [Haloarculaceae archaeon H-GB2-1]
MYEGIQGSQQDGHRIDELYEVLAHRRRRFVLYELYERDSHVSVSELVDALFAWEHRAGDEQTTRESIRASLVRSHLPRMERAGIVNYDAEANTVSLAPGESQTKQIRDLAISHARR